MIVEVGLSRLEVLTGQQKSHVTTEPKSAVKYFSFLKLQRSSLEGMSGDSSSSGDGDSSDVQEVPSQYETWDIARYKRAKTERARGRFWAHASEDAKGRMIQSLLTEPDMSPVTVQARNKGWIPF